MEGAMRTPANYVPLSPISFLERAAAVCRDDTSVVYGSVRFTWRETRDRCVRLASALSSLGISSTDVVAALAPNIPAMYELHFGVPMVGGVLCTLNTRHDAAMLSVLLRHSEAKVIFVDYQFLEVARETLKLLSKSTTKVPLLIVIKELDKVVASTAIVPSNELDYEVLLENADTEFQIKWPKDECQPISLNYTSGTTSAPKGVVYSHRGAYLNSLSVIIFNAMGSMPVYLWTVPMFHCNGWCCAWAVAAQGGTNVCFRSVSGRAIFDQIAAHKVTHMGGAPTVLNMIVNSPPSDQKPLPGRVVVSVGGAPPPPKVLFKMEEFGFHVIHSYGLTETYGPGTVCEWKPQWNSLDAERRAKLKSRQGLQHQTMQAVDIKNPITMESVPGDGITMGEVMFKGNTVMSGYLKDTRATEQAFEGGWYRTGDLAVRHPDGYIELKDRSKDVIITGGENVSTIEVESVIFSHPSVLDAAVVGRPDEHWGETPCAFIKLKEGHKVDAAEIIQFCRAKLPHYMAPRTVVFEDDLPKTSTGKTKKFLLKEKAKAMGGLTGKKFSKL
ncbi:butanoate--CoA ligase AAE1 [Nymphaea colorata]|nr:butanoate--CoA ligase AAE1 [Nymphaea colorata]